MHSVLKVAAGLGFMVSPIGDLPEFALSILTGVKDIPKCLDYLDQPAAAASKFMSPCFPANPQVLAAMPVLFVIVGLCLLIWAAYPYAKPLIIKES